MEMQLTENTTLFADATSVPEFKDKSWDRFIDLAKEGKQISKYPRKSVYLDADLHKGLKELKLFNDGSKATSINDLMNAIVRSFMEINTPKLKKFRKYIDVKSVFDGN